MKKAFSLGAGVLLYVKGEKICLSIILNKKELLSLDEESPFSRRRRMFYTSSREKGFVRQNKQFGLSA